MATKNGTKRNVKNLAEKASTYARSSAAKLVRALIDCSSYLKDVIQY